MKFNELKKLLGNKYNVDKIKKIINSIAPVDIKRRLRGEKNSENLIIKIIKSKLA